MDIVIGRAATIHKDASREDSPGYTPRKKKTMDRRKNKQDRRKSVRDGVIVSLSFKHDRRVRRDRRKKRPA